MASITEQRADENGLFIRATNGKTVTILATDILEHFRVAPGSDVEKRMDTRGWIKNGIEQYLGEDIVTYDGIDVDFDIETGRITNLSLI